MGATHLTQEDRFYIEKRLTDNTSIRGIAKELGRSPGTISREVRRNTPSDFQGLYSHRVATNLSEYRRTKASKNKAFEGINALIDSYIRARLSTHTSPDIISGELRVKHQMFISERTIYRYINHLEAAGESIRAQLPQHGKAYKRSGTVRSTIKNRVDISKRPKIADEKTEIGHVEIEGFEDVISSTFYDF